MMFETSRYKYRIATILAIVLAIYVGLRITGFTRVHSINRDRQRDYQRSVLGGLEMIDHFLEVHYRAHQKYPAQLEEIFEGLNFDDNEIARLCRDARGNRFRYQYPPTKNRFRPDVWVEDHQSGIMIGNW